MPSATGYINASASALQDGSMAEPFAKIGLAGGPIGFSVSDAPSAGVSGPADGVLYQSRTFTFTASGSSDDNAAGYTYNINWGDGSPVQTVPASAGNTTITESYTYAGTGTFSVSVTATDQFNLTSAPASQEIAIGTAVLESDSSGEGGITGLAISGTSAASGITLTPSGTAGAITVKRGNSTLGTFTPTGGTIAIYGDGGNDPVTLNGVTNSMNTFTLSGNTATLTAASLGSQVFTIGLDSVTSITCQGGQSGNSFTDNAATVASTWLGGAGANSYTFAGTSMGSPVSITGGTGLNNTLYGPALASNQTNVWTISGSNQGNLNGNSWSFTKVQNLIGGSNDDDFVFTGNGTVNGKIDGGGSYSAAGNTLDYSAYNRSVSVNLNTIRATGIGMTFANIQSAIGDAADSNTLVGTNNNTNNIWSITAANSGTLNSFTFANFGNLTAVGTMDSFILGNSGSVSGTLYGSAIGADLLVGPNVPTTFYINANNRGYVGNGGSVVHLFIDLPNLTGGTQANRFVFSAATIANNLVGGSGGATVDYSAYTTPTMVNLQTDKATGVSGTATGITGFVGGSGTNTVTGTNGNNTWNITGTNAGNINGTFAFSSAGKLNLTGGSGNDDFIFSDGAGVGGTINGGAGTNTLDYSAYNTGVYVNLATGTGATGASSLSKIQQVYGSGHNDVLVGNGLNVLLAETAGNNLLIGGSSSATIDSGAGYDLVIAGTTSYDTGTSANAELEEIESYWSSVTSGNFTMTVSTLSTTGTPTHNYKLNNSTVKHNSNSSDTITLGSGNDWVFYRATGSFADSLTGTPGQPSNI